MHIYFTQLNTPFCLINLPTYLLLSAVPVGRSKAWAEKSEINPNLFLVLWGNGSPLFTRLISVSIQGADN